MSNFFFFFEKHVYEYINKLISKSDIKRKLYTLAVNKHSQECKENKIRKFCRVCFTPLLFQVALFSEKENYTN